MCVSVCVRACMFSEVWGVSQKKRIFKLTSKTFLKVDHFYINGEKNLTDQKAFVNYLCH